MTMETVEGMIADALADEQKTGRLANALRERAAAHGRSPGDEDVRGAVEFVAEYVEHVPAYLRDGLEAARMAGREAEMSAVIQDATEYWLAESDIIPDRLGLLGILDDAYYSLSLMQAVTGQRGLSDPGKEHPRGRLPHRDRSRQVEWVGHGGRPHGDELSSGSFPHSASRPDLGGPLDGRGRQGPSRTPGTGLRSRFFCRSAEDGTLAA